MCAAAGVLCASSDIESSFSCAGVFVWSGVARPPDGPDSAGRSATPSRPRVSRCNRYLDSAARAGRVDRCRSALISGSAGGLMLTLGTGSNCALESLSSLTFETL